MQNTFRFKNIPEKSYYESRIPTCACAIITDSSLALVAFGNESAISISRQNMPDIINIEYNENDDMQVYLQYEANQRGIGIEEVRKEEEALKQRAKELTFSSKQLAAIAKASKPNERFLEGNEEYPF